MYLGRSTSTHFNFLGGKWKETPDIEYNYLNHNPLNIMIAGYRSYSRREHRGGRFWKPLSQDLQVSAVDGPQVDLHGDWESSKPCIYKCLWWCSTLAIPFTTLLLPEDEEEGDFKKPDLHAFQVVVAPRAQSLLVKNYLSRSVPCQIDKHHIIINQQNCFSNFSQTVATAI